MQKFTVAVSGLNTADNPGPGIGVARSLRKDSGLEIEIIGLAYDAMEPGIYMDWVVDKSYLMPYPVSGWPAYLERLLQICETHDVNMVIPNLDVELPFFIKSRAALAERGIHTFLPDREQFRLRGKDRLTDISAGIGLKEPRTRLIHSPEEVSSVLEEMGLPVMVKGIYYEAYRADTLDTVVEKVHRLAAVWGYPVIVQKIVTGEHLNLVGLGDGQGGSLGLLGIRKVSQTALGKIWTGVTVRNEVMLSAAKRFMALYNWRGPFELECIARGDDLYLIEINPRFPAWVYFATEVGINLPARMLRHCMQAAVDQLPAYDAGKLFVRYTWEMVTDQARFQNFILQGENA